jgi:hypothetical protein
VGFGSGFNGLGFPEREGFSAGGKGQIIKLLFLLMEPGSAVGMDLDGQSTIGDAEGDVAVGGAVAIDVDAAATLLGGELEPVVFGGECMTEAGVCVVDADHSIFIIDEGPDLDGGVVLCLQNIAEEGRENVGEEVFFGVEA